MKIIDLRIKLSIKMKIFYLKNLLKIWTKNLEKFILRVDYRILSENIYPSNLALFDFKFDFIVIRYLFSS